MFASLPHSTSLSSLSASRSLSSVAALSSDDFLLVSKASSLIRKAISSTSSPKDISLAFQSSRLISDAVESSGPSTASSSVRRGLPGPLSMTKFVNFMRADPASASLLLISLELCKDTSTPSSVRDATAGVFNHEFNLVDGKRVSHIEARPSKVGSSSSNAPSLSGLLSLFAIANKRASLQPYEVLGRNCYWMGDMLFYTLAKRYTVHWLSGTLTPDEPLRRYLLGKDGILGTAILCAQPNGSPAVQWFTFVAVFVVRGIQTVLTQNEPGKFVMHDEEAIKWNKEWEEKEKRQSMM
ncbi:hypothetical protein TRAPUB_12733 [Trametes pubescens]|uniref:Uncharacterized protein n=1 Tax=Trametes pubescens TaxID=154538 RepID=A0A1M2VTA5_TRAPU|nr:hypothetical protein TRAPUB_12733 [Trametes pubescens]